MKTTKKQTLSVSGQYSINMKSREVLLIIRSLFATFFSEKSCIFLFCFLQRDAKKPRNINEPNICCIYSQAQWYGICHKAMFKMRVSHVDNLIGQK